MAKRPGARATDFETLAEESFLVVLEYHAATHFFSQCPDADFLDGLNWVRLVGKRLFAVARRALEVDRARLDALAEQFATNPELLREFLDSREKGEER